MPTKTDSLPTVEQATADLDKARAKFDHLRDAVIAGDSKVTAKDVADAQDAIKFAELRLELASNADADLDEQKRQARIAELVGSLTTGDVATKGRKVVDLEAKASAAVEALHVAAADYRDTVRASAQELGRLGELPDHVQVENLNYQPNKIVIDGVLIQGSYNFGDWPGNVLLGAIYRALHPHYHQSLGDKAKDLVNTAARVLVGGIKDTKATATEQLAHQLEQIRGEQ